MPAAPGGSFVAGERLNHHQSQDALFPGQILIPYEPVCGGIMKHIPVLLIPILCPFAGEGVIRIFSQIL
jgi:hypothetical protein